VASAGRSLAYVQQNDRSPQAELKLILEEAAGREVSRLRPLSALAVESCVTTYNRPTGRLQTRHGGTLDAQSARTPTHT
jgi:hypothetical protein